MELPDINVLLMPEMQFYWTSLINGLVNYPTADLPSVDKVIKPINFTWIPNVTEVLLTS